MDEAQVKAAILSQIRQESRGQQKPVVTAEFSLGTSGIRSDLAIFSDETIGFEIKTARDTLRRLPAQMRAYSRYFNRSIVVVAPCHLKTIAECHLSGASVWTYDDKGSLAQMRAGTATSVDATVLEDVMTRAERRKGDFHSAMRARYLHTSQNFWQVVGRRQIRPSDLSLLSRFAAGREQARLWAAQREAEWERWLSEQNETNLAAASA